MPQAKKKHAIRHVVEQVTGTPWMITPERLDLMLELLQLRDEGVILTREEIRQRLSAFETEFEAEPRDEAGGIRVLPMFGIMAPRMNLIMEFSGGTSTQIFEQWFRSALRDDRVSAILFECDSPGGSALGNEELSEVIYAARGQKPIWAFVNGLCASANYYVASAADRIIASPSSLVGSIGTVLIHGERSKADEQSGRKFSVIAAGKHKVDGNQYEPLSEQGRATLQQRVDHYYAQFVAAVAKHRGVSTTEVVRGYGEGDVLIASEALAAGLIDEVAGFEETLAKLQFLTRRSAAQPISATAAQGGAKGGSSKGESKMEISAKLKALLYAMEMIDDQEADNAACLAAIRAFFKGRGADVPKEEAAIIKAMTSAKSEGAGRKSEGGEPPPEGAGAKQPLTADDVKQAQLAERNRIADIRARGKLLGVSAEEIETAIDSGEPTPAIVDGWTRKLAEQETPVAKPDITPGEAALDKFVPAAADGLLARAGLWDEEQKLSESARQCAGMRWVALARESLRMAGGRTSDDDEADALAFLQLGGNGSEILAAEGSYRSPSDYPNLLSNLAGKMLDRAIDIAEVTYPRWTARMADVADFKPKTIIGIGSFDKLDRLADDEEPETLESGEEVNWVQADRFGNKVPLTVHMIVNDDLDGFNMQLQSLMEAHERTLNDLCLGLLTGNVTLADGVALFHDGSHGNDVTSGGEPSVDQVEAMRKKHRAQTGINNVGKVRNPIRIALVPSALETVAEQVFLPAPEFRPTTDATINPFRGRIEPVMEPELDTASAVKWYTLADPRARRTIVHGFQRGFGRGGRRTTWFEPGRKTRYWDVEGRFFAAAISHRGIVRNAGQ